MTAHISIGLRRRLERAFGLLAITAALAGSQTSDWRSWPTRVFRPRPYDALHYRIELRFDHGRRFFMGRTTVTVLPTKGPLTSLELDAEVFTVRSASDAAGRTLQFHQSDGTVSVSLPESARMGDTVRVTLAYDGTEVDMDTERWGMARDYHLGLDFLDSTAEHPSLISTLSFPAGARHWFPCNDHPSDKATQELVATVPKEWMAISNGRLTANDLGLDGTRTVRWLLDKPHSTYLSVLAAGPYVAVRDTAGSVPLVYWVYPQHAADARRSFEQTPAVIAFFERIYGVPFPWDRYDQITIPGINGGAESTTATVVGHSTIHDERAEQDFPSHWLVAHEAAHQWWGDLVTFKDWGDTWINESFATYSEYLYTRASMGEEEGALNLQEKRNAYFREAKNRHRRPIVLDRWRFPNDNFDAHTYPKGAAVLHMLRREVGDASFFAFLQRVLRRHAFGSATTADVIGAASEVSGRDLRWFFDQWLMRPGHPVLSVGHRWDERQRRLYLTVDQVQDTADGTPIYRIPVRISIATTAGIIDSVLMTEKRRHEFVLDCAHRPVLVEVDPHHELLAEFVEGRGADQLLVQIERGNSLSRMFAASALAKHANMSEVRAALKQSGKQDGFWAVRKAAIEALGRPDDEADRMYLRDRLKDAASKVRAAAVRVLGSTGDGQEKELLVRIWEQDGSYVVQAEALRALGRLRDTSLLPLFRNARTLPSPRNMIRSSADEAIRMTEGGS